MKILETEDVDDEDSGDGESRQEDVDVEAADEQLKMSSCRTLKVLTSN